MDQNPVGRELSATYPDSWRSGKDVVMPDGKYSPPHSVPDMRQLRFRHRRRVVVEDLPLAIELLIDKGVARLHLSGLAIGLGQGKGVDATVHGHVAAQPVNLAVIDLPHRLERQEVIKVVPDLGRCGAYLIGYRRLQHGIRGIQLDHGLDVTRLQGRVPTIKQPGNLTVLHVLRLFGHAAVDIRDRRCRLDKRGAQGNQQDEGRGFQFHGDAPVMFDQPTLPFRTARAIGQPE